MADIDGGQSTVDKQQESPETNLSLEEEAGEATQTQIETSAPETEIPATDEIPAPETQTPGTETTATETETPTPVTEAETEIPTTVTETTATETETPTPVTGTETETSVTGAETETPATVTETTATETETPAIETETTISVTGTETHTAENQPEIDPVTMSAVVIGGTGATGKCLIEYLLKNKRKFSKVTVIGRRHIDNVGEIDIQAETDKNRLIQYVEFEDMNAMPDDRIKEICEGNDVFFCCLGTTRRAAGSAEAFHQIDHDLTMKFIRQAKSANIPHCSYVSSTGANSNSMLLYLRTKGEVEQGIQALGFPYVTIMRPGLLNRGGEMRFMEKVANFIFHGISVSTVAKAMAIDAYHYKKTSQTQSEASGNNVTVMTNADINRTVQEAAAQDNATS